MKKLCKMNELMKKLASLLTINGLVPTNAFFVSSANKNASFSVSQFYDAVNVTKKPLLKQTED